MSDTPRHDEGEQVGDAMNAIARAMDQDEPASPPGEQSGASADRSMIEQALERGIRALEADGDPPALAVRESVSMLVGQIYAARDGRSAPGRRELADRFLLDDAPATQAIDPRLADARDAQTVMERHITAAFRGDADQIAAAIRESRRLISDALRRGLAVSVRNGGVRP